MNNWKTETELADLSGYSKQALRAWRKGVTVKKKFYEPRLEEGKHWKKIGRGVFFSPEVVAHTLALKKVMKREVES